MRCPTLEEAPPPPQGKSGWPWTVETPSRPDSGATRWPRISVVLVSLNYGRYIEEMLRSVLLQGYPDVELIVIDGGSTDSTLEVLARYAKWISYSVSEPDRCQSEAYNKGLARVTGTIFIPCDADDYFVPGAFLSVGEVHSRIPDAIVSGDVTYLWETRQTTETCRAKAISLHDLAAWWNDAQFAMPGMFYPTAKLSRAGLMSEELHYLMDYDFTLRYLEHAEVVAAGAPVIYVRRHSEAKLLANADEAWWEYARISKQISTRFPDLAMSATRMMAGLLFGTGLRRLLRGKPFWRYVREGFRTHPFWAVYWVFPGGLLRRWRRFRAA